MPRINNDTKLLCFDLETNGLHGQAFAVGGLIMDAAGNIESQYSARCPIKGELDEWVSENVIPFIEDMEQTHKDYKSFCDDFWAWFVEAQNRSDYVIVQNGYPVEYRFLLQCQEMDIESRYWDHPFPILDLTSMLVMAGYDAEDKVRLAGQWLKETGFAKHHPLNDAHLTARMAFEILSKSK